jgi:hypothetical protein
MKLKNLYLILFLLLGEGIIIVSFNHFGRDVQPDILTSNIIVASVIFCLCAVELMNPIIDLNDETQADIGGIGIRWVFLFVFIFGSIAVMAYSLVNNKTDFISFWLFESILLMVLILGLYFSKTVTEKVSQVYHEEKKLRSQLLEIKACIDDLKFVGQVEGKLNQDDQNALNELLENLRYLSPSNHAKAAELEAAILLDLQLLKSELSKTVQIQNTKAILGRCDLMYKQRKQLYSN